MARVFMVPSMRGISLRIIILQKKDMAGEAAALLPYAVSHLGDLQNSHLSANALDFLPQDAHTDRRKRGRRNAREEQVSIAPAMSVAASSVMSTFAYRPPLSALSMA